MTKERRAGRRFSIDHMVEIEFGREALVHASGVNISASGLLCSCDSYVEPETEVSLVVTIPSGPAGHTIDCEGVVVRAEKGKGHYLTGIRFTTLADKDVGAISAFLESVPS